MRTRERRAAEAFADLAREYRDLLPALYRAGRQLPDVTADDRFEAPRRDRASLLEALSKALPFTLYGTLLEPWDLLAEERFGMGDLTDVPTRANWRPAPAVLR